MLCMEDFILSLKRCDGDWHILMHFLGCKEEMLAGP
jgi:hypothetical protein